MKIRSVNDYKEPLNKVFNIEWQPKNNADQKNLSMDRQRWSDEDKIKVVRLAATGIPVDDICELLGRSRMSINMVLGKVSCAIIDAGSEYAKVSK
ncbi:MAG: helix-turn-helix domain-containing protein [Candidatus Thiodiazotropha taylori]|uniref:Helix-turn-helix domain-containing protein n=1 Tax=Candidatus Thiodiazotropha taylori TaxID=2792791 RepID=A0A9E4K9B1_9GAMM|nr:helix-turn-helix domain-containing protein [Candidatus Thiodiazotropha taylori]MCW4254953.1 helix-turn-helix domain-containing protein [Candidatus Thiodiazotropha taylori]